MITSNNMQCRSPARQRGVVLFIALIALVVMTLAGIALVRSVDTGNVIAGNFAFKQGTVQAGDIGVELAYTALQNIVGTTLDTNIPGQYFATMQATDGAGIPTSIAWASVTCRDATGAIVSCTDQSLYRVQYVIDRLCTGALPITDKQKQCYHDAPTGGGSKKADAVSFSGATTIYYRVTVRVLGPRETVSFVQAVITA